MFAILGINLLSNQMEHCDVPNYYNINYEDCVKLEKTWKKFPANFDNIYSAMITLFIISSLTGWSNIMFEAIDSQDKKIVFFNY